MRARRRGYSLIECLVVMTLLGAVLSFVTLTIHATFRVQRQWTDASAYSRAIERLVAQLRADAHRATAASVAEPATQGGAGRGLSLTLPAAETVQYTAGPRGIDRVVRRGEKIAHRETYPVSAAAAAWHVRRDAGRPLVSLDLNLQTDARPEGPAACPPYRFTAAVGLPGSGGRKTAPAGGTP
jgi:prepilin-type N-terminal cleavage/methylation domain-containing protein